MLVGVSEQAGSETVGSLSLVRLVERHMAEVDD